MSDVIKSEEEEADKPVDYGDVDDDEKQAVVKDTIDLDINENNGEREGKPAAGSIPIPPPVAAKKSDHDNDGNANDANQDQNNDKPKADPEPQLANQQSLASGRRRAASKVTSAYYSDDEDEKQGLIFGPAGMNPTAGFDENEEYFENLEDKIVNAHRMRSERKLVRKRSASWVGNNEMNEGDKEQEIEKSVESAGSAELQRLKYQRISYQIFV